MRASKVQTSLRKCVQQRLVNAPSFKRICCSNNQTLIERTYSWVVLNKNKLLIQEVFRVHLNIFEIAATRLFLIIL